MVARLVFANKFMIGLAKQKMQKISENTESPTIFRRIAAGDPTAVRDCVDAYGNYIWKLAKKFTASPEDAESATREVFNDIWFFAERCAATDSDENLLILLIVRRRLNLYRQQSQTR